MMVTALAVRLRAPSPQRGHTAFLRRSAIMRPRATAASLIWASNSPALTALIRASMIAGIEVTHRDLYQQSSSPRAEAVVVGSDCLRTAESTQQRPLCQTASERRSSALSVQTVEPLSH